MAKKKTTVRRVPQSATPRTFGDGQASAAAPAESAQSVAPRANGSTSRFGTQDLRRRASSRTESRPQVPLAVEYAYVKGDLGRLGILAGAMLALLIVLGLIIH